jgi:hypothetical protein
MNKQERFDADLSAIEFQAPQFNMDAGETVFFARQLEYIRPKIYDVKRPKLSALTTFPIDSSVPEWAERVTYRMYDATGYAKIIASYADDLPMVGINATEFSSPIRSIGDAYGWSTAELRAAAATNTPLQSKKATMAKRAHDILTNKIAWYGDAISGLPGFFTNTNIPTYTIPADGAGGGGSNTEFVDKTPDQIIRDMNGTVSAVFVQSNGVHTANELWMPLAQYTYIRNTIRGSQSDATIWKVWTDANPGVTIKPILELKAVPQYSNQDVMVAIENDVENLQLVLPMLFQQLPPQANNLAWKVPCESRVGGVIIEYPFAMVIAAGI